MQKSLSPLPSNDVGEGICVSGIAAGIQFIT